MSTPQIVYDLLEITSGTAYNESIADAWYKLTGVQFGDRSINTNILVSEYYSLFLEENDPKANSSMASTLGKIVREARLDAINTDGTNGYFSGVLLPTALYTGRVQRNASRQGLRPGARFDKLLEEAEGAMDKRRSVKYSKEVRELRTAGQFGAGNARSSRGVDPRTKDEALSPDLNEDLALAFYFMLWLMAKKDELTEQGVIQNPENLEDEDFNRSLLDTIENNIRNQQDPSLGESSLAPENIASARKLISTSEFDKQRYLIQRIDELSQLSRDRFFYNVPFGFSSEDPQEEQSPDIELNPYQWVGIAQTKILRFTNTQKNAVGKVTGAAFGKELFNMSSEQLSKLVPTIKLWKVSYNEEMFKSREVEIKFPTQSQIMKEEIFDINPNFAKDINSKSNPFTFPKTRRGYGIKSFNWQYDGNDPFSVDRDISATLELYFQDFSQFTALRGKGEDSYRYLDLLVASDKNYVGEKARLGEFFQQDIRIQAGWEVPNTFSESQKEAIRASQVNFVLTMQDYNISFEGNGNGACTISISYRARIESLGKNRLINVLAATKEEVDELERLDIIIEETKSEKDREEAKEKQKEELKLIRSAASKRFIDRLISKGSIYWREVDLKEVLISTLGPVSAKFTYETLYDDNWGDNPPRHDDGLQKSLEVLLEEGQGTPLENLPLVTFFEETTADEKIKGPEKIIYTFFGDIVQNAIEIASESGNFLGAPKEALEEIKIALLDFRVGNKPYNIADIPVELNVLMSFMQSKFGQKDIQTVSMVSFIKGLLAEVITNRIEEYFNLKDGTSRSFKIGYNSQNKNLKPVTQRAYDLLNTNDLRIIRKGPQNDDLIVYADSPIPSDFVIRQGKYFEKKESDEIEGLHHFTLGSNKSIIKNISFDRIDLEYARERRLTINKEDPYALLANVFNVNIAMFGNDYFKPGSYIYVDPKVMGDVGAPYIEGSIANIMGLGGYHIITKVQHSISGNSFETTIEAVWETSGTGKFGMTSSNRKKKSTKENKENNGN